MSQKEAPDNKVNIVAIHGVGDRKPGTVLDAVLLGLSRHAKISSRETSIVCHDHIYRQAEVRGHPYVASVLEVNWDDISHPAHSLVEYVTHFFSILASMLRNAVKLVDGNHSASSLPLRVYRWAFNTLLLWCIYFPVATIAGFAPTRVSQIAWIFSTAAMVALLAKLLSPYDKGFRAGWVWAVGVVLVGILSISDGAFRAVGLSVATWTYGTAQGFTGLALFVAMFVTWHRSRVVRSEQRVARLAFLYLPFALFSGIGALVWAGTLAIANYILPEQSLKNWSEEYLSRLIYDLAFTEALLALGVAAGGLLLLLPALALRREDRGARVHARLYTALRIFPLIVIAVFVLYVAHLFFFGGELATSGPYPAFNAWVKPWLWPLLSSFGITLSADANPKVFEIYLASSLRLMPFLVYLVGPFRVMLDTVGDVLLYVDPVGQLNRGNVRVGSQQRLVNALDHLIETDKNRTVLLLAHSQGTAIAADVLAKKHWEKIRLVSMGSPISSLYWRFMGSEAVTAPPVPWLNLFRTGDYIAGGEGIRAPWVPMADVEDRSLGVGRHSGYFEDSKVWDAIRCVLEPSASPIAVIERQVLESHVKI